jgi:hypothetical protein
VHASRTVELLAVKVRGDKGPVVVHLVVHADPPTAPRSSDHWKGVFCVRGEATVGTAKDDRLVMTRMLGPWVIIQPHA